MFAFGLDNSIRQERPYPATNMNFRRLLLRILFISLAAAAVLGAAGVLLASSQAAWKIVATCIATAAAALLLLATGLLARRQRSSALAAAALIILEYLLVLALTWFDWNWPVGEKVGMTMFVLAACGIPAVAFLHLKDVRAAHLAARVGLILAATDFAIFMIAGWVVGYPIDLSPVWDDRLYTIGGGLAGFGILAVLCLIGAKVDQHHWRWLGVAACAIGFAIILYAVLLGVYSTSPLFTCIIVIASVCAHANVLLRVPLKGNQVYLLWITIAAGILTGACVVLVAFHSHGDPLSEQGLRLAGASAIVAGCGSLALLVLARINRKIHAPPPQLAAIHEIALTCPFCQKKQTFPTGEARCVGCGLLLHIRLSEPRCPACDYSLLMLKADRCPECGTPVAVSGQLSAGSQSPPLLADC